MNWSLLIEVCAGTVGVATVDGLELLPPPQPAARAAIGTAMRQIARFMKRGKVPEGYGRP